jgi:hypothetical protein
MGHTPHINGKLPLVSWPGMKMKSMSEWMSRRIRLGIGMAVALPLIGSLTGCLGYVDGGYGGYGDYGGYDEGPGPDLFLFGGGYDRGRDEQAYSHRGSASRASVHAGGGHGGGHSGGGHGGGRR